MPLADTTLAQAWPALLGGAAVVGWLWNAGRNAFGIGRTLENAMPRTACDARHEAQRVALDVELKRLERELHGKASKADLVEARGLIYEMRENSAAMGARMDSLGEKIDSLRELVEKALAKD